MSLAGRAKNKYKRAFFHLDKAMTENIIDHPPAFNANIDELAEWLRSIPQVIPKNKVDAVMKMQSNPNKRDELKKLIHEAKRLRAREVKNKRGTLPIKLQKLTKAGRDEDTGGKEAANNGDSNARPPRRAKKNDVS